MLLTDIDGYKQTSSQTSYQTQTTRNTIVAGARNNTDTVGSFIKYHVTSVGYSYTQLTL